MKIPLKDIKPSSNPIRKTWDEQKMRELVESFQCEGQVEPIGVRSNDKDDKYIVVWGHRRVEAARRANWDEIDCIIVPNDEVNNLIQAGIENLSKEDMCLNDKARWANDLLEMGLSRGEIHRRSSIPQTNISYWLTYWNEKNNGVIIDDGIDTRDEGLQKTVVISTVFGDDLESKKAIAKKTSLDKLNRDQTRAVAEAYRDAPTPEVKQKILEVPIITKDTASDILRRSVARVELETGQKITKETNDWYKEKEERKSIEKYDLAVKSFIDAARLFRQEAQKVPNHVKNNKYSPEAARFVTRRLNELIGDLKTDIEFLENVK